MIKMKKQCKICLTENTYSRADIKYVRRKNGYLQSNYFCICPFCLNLIQINNPYDFSLYLNLLDFDKYFNDTDYFKS